MEMELELALLFIGESVYRGWVVLIVRSDCLSSL